MHHMVEIGLHPKIDSTRREPIIGMSYFLRMAVCEAFTCSLHCGQSKETARSYLFTFR